MSERASRNRTITCSEQELSEFSKTLMRPESAVDHQDIECRLIKGDFFKVAGFLPCQFVDLLVLDPPYNLTKNYNGSQFRQLDGEDYSRWFQSVIDLLIPMLKQTATIYVCSDWRTSTLVFPILDKCFAVRNRITWERDKGRGAKRNWKNNTEDIWFCTVSDNFFFDVDAVKLKRRVMAPYRERGKPKDWNRENDGSYRYTHPSNIWTDLTVPFWSMPENTQHPAQKPEKLIAKLVLASSKERDFVFDPFLGSGTSAVVAEKLGRRWSGIEINSEYLCWASKRIRDARLDSGIQGYLDGVFWERNSLPHRQRRISNWHEKATTTPEALFK